MEINFDKLIGKKVIKAPKLSGGVNNPTHKIFCEDGSKYILQFSGDKFLDRAVKQPLIVNLLKEKTNLPIAGIIKADATKKIVDKDYIILEFVEGHLLQNVSDDFTNKEIVKLYKDIAKYLSSLHSVKVDYFGEFVVENNSLKIMPRYSTAKEQVYKEYESWIDKARGTPFEHFIPDLKSWLKDNINVFGRDIKPCLTHNDFSNTNLLVLDDGTIAAVIDLDDIAGGNNVADIYRIYANFDGDKKDLALKTFFENYKVKLPVNFEKQILFYDKTHVLAYIDCWEQIVDSYTSEALEEMTEKMTKDIVFLLGSKI